MRTIIHRYLRWLLVIGLVFGVLPVAASPLATVTFRDSSVVNDTAIYLKDIAAIDCASETIRIRLGNLVIGEAAPAGFSRLVTTHDAMMYRIMPNAKDIDIKQVNSGRIRVSTRCVEKRVGEFFEKIREYVAGQVSWKRDDYAIEVVNGEASWKCLDAPIEVAVTGLANAYPKGMVRLELLARQGGRITRIPVSCRIAVCLPVAIASSPIRRGSIITVDDVEMKKCDISSFGPTPFFSLPEVLGRRADRSISRGTILHGRTCSLPPTVTRGDPITISMARGAVRIGVAAIARESGSIGEKIWVENSTTNKLVRVTITDRHTAELL